MEFAKRFHTEVVPIVETISNAKMNCELISVGLQKVFSSFCSDGVETELIFLA